MSQTQRRKDSRSHKQCRRCAGPTGRHAVCSKCSPHKATGGHVDKYAAQRDERESE